MGIISIVLVDRILFWAMIHLRVILLLVCLYDKELSGFASKLMHEPGGEGVWGLIGLGISISDDKTFKLSRCEVLSHSVAQS